jgi:hypothetical protein
LVTILANGTVIGAHLIKVFMFLEEVGHVEKRVALQAEIHECRLHSGEHARDASLMNAAGERIFIGALEINLAQQIVFDQRDFGLLPVGRDYQFLAHSGLHARGIPRGD